MFPVCCQSGPAAGCHEQDLLAGLAAHDGPQAIVCCSREAKLLHEYDAVKGQAPACHQPRKDEQMQLEVHEFYGMVYTAYKDCMQDCILSTGLHKDCMQGCMQK
jgi:hypothetical protein